MIADEGVILRLPEGELEVQRIDGTIVLVARGDLRIQSEGAIEIAGKQGVRLVAGVSSIEVSPVTIDLQSRGLEGRVGEVRFEGERIRARADDVQVVWGKFEQVVGRLFEFAREVYQRVEGLLHVRARRVRAEVREGYRLQAGHAALVAEDDVRIAECGRRRLAVLQ